MREMIALAALTAGLTGVAPALAATPTYIYCSAPSTSSRGTGLIITSVFRSRSDRQFVVNAFTNYLRNSYAPYGNGWIFADGTPSCASFQKKNEAESQRQVDISHVPQPEQSIFNLNFVMQ
jgi:hypothetical protein